MTKEERREQNIKIMKDFFAFKINIFPILVKILFALLVVGVVFFGLKTMMDGFESKETLSVVIGIGTIALGPFLLHMTFELLLLLFTIVDLLREIRNNIFKLLENKEQ